MSEDAGADNNAAHVFVYAPGQDAARRRESMTAVV